MTGKLLRFERRSEKPGQEALDVSQESRPLGTWKPVQQSLFPLANVAVIVSLSEDLGAHLLSLVQQARPAYVFDFRSVPRFDFGNMNRSRFFECFEQLQSRYVEVSNDEGGEWRALLLTRFPNRVEHPLMFLVNEGRDDLENAIVRFIADNRDWAIQKISSQSPSEKIAKLR